MPEGTLAAIVGGKHVSDAGAVIARLDKAKAKYDDIVLCHGGGLGVERIAAQWAERNGVQPGRVQTASARASARHVRNPHDPTWVRRERRHRETL